MLNKAISFFLALALSAAALPAAYAANNDIFVYESFENYPTNSSDFSNMSVKLTAGADKRVICEEGTFNKALYAKAQGSSVKAVAAVSASEEDTQFVLDAKLKLEGQYTGCNFFTLSGGGESISLLRAEDNGRLYLHDGKLIGRMTLGRAVEITLVLNKKSSLYTVYIDKKAVAENIYLPDGKYNSINEVSWVVNEPDDAFSEFYIDDVKIYAGSNLPWDMSFPAVEYSNEVVDFTPQPTDGSQLQIYKQISFDSGKITEMDNVARSNAEISAATLEGSSAIWVKAAKQTATYFDVQLNSLADVDKYIISMDLMINELSGDAYIAFFDGKDTSWRQTGRITAGGSVSLATALGRYTNAGAEIPTGKRVEIAVAFDNVQNIYSLYVDGELIKTVDSSAFKVRPTTLRMLDCQIVSSGKLDIVFDNIRIYKAKKPLEREYFEEEEKTESPINASGTSVADTSAEAVAAIGGGSVLMLTNNSYFAHGEKKEYADGDRPYIDNGTMMISESLAKSLYPDFDAGNSELNTAVVDGKTYIPLRFLAQEIQKQRVWYDERGFVILTDSNTDFANSDRVLSVNEPSDQIYRYMQFENPTGEKMLDDLKNNMQHNEHPRLLITKDDIDYLYEKRDSNYEWKGAYDSLLSAADSYTVGFTVSSTADQNAASSFCNAMEKLCLAYLMTGENKYADAGVGLMETVCGWDTLGETTSQLTSGFWAAGMAYGMDGLYSYLQKNETGRQKYAYFLKRINELAFDKVIGAYKNGSDTIKWPTMDDNFPGVIAGGMMLLALSVADTQELSEQCVYLLENLYKTMTLTLSIFAPDGAWYEGVSYGDYCLRNLMPSLLAMKNSCGSMYGLLDFKGADKLQDWYTYTGTPQYCFNFHDMSATKMNQYYCFAGFYAAYLTNNTTAMAAAKRWWSMGSNSMPLLAMMMYDRSITDKGIEVDLNDIPKDHYFRTAEAGTFYSSHASQNPAFVGIHGGETGLPHDMLDLGEFVFAADGEIWAYDLGSDNYSLPQYFNIPYGYRFYRKNAQGENVVVINPMKDASYYGQTVGTRAELLFFDSKPRAAKAAYDLTSAYERDVSSYVRGYYFGDNRNTLTVRDEIVLKATSDLYWQMHTTADIEIEDNHTAILTSNGKKCRVSIWCSTDGYTVESMKCELLAGSPGIIDSDGAKSNDHAQKLVLHLPKAAAGKLDIVVKLSPISENYSCSPIDTTTQIADWMLPDGEIPKPLLLDKLYYDAKEVPDFEAERQEYTITLPFGQETAPTITAEAEEGINVEVRDSGDVTKPITVVLSKDGYADTVYTVKLNINSDRSIKVTQALQDVMPKVGVSGELIMPKLASASSVPEEANGPMKMIDGDLTTRCAVNNNCWMEIDLGSVIEFSGVAIAFMDGSKRQAIFDLMYSEDGVNFTKVFAGKSTGETDGYEDIAIAGKARYIRYAGYGNSLSNWNSITEFCVYK